jgi:hypothetical protein
LNCSIESIPSGFDPREYGFIAIQTERPTVVSQQQNQRFHIRVPARLALTDFVRLSVIRNERPVINKDFPPVIVHAPPLNKLGATKPAAAELANNLNL